MANLKAFLELTMVLPAGLTGHTKAASIRHFTCASVLVANFQLADIPIVEIDHLIEHLQLIAPVPLERLIVHSERST